MATFVDVAVQATGFEPYPWQASVAAGEKLPDLIAVETGAGKTAGIVLPWIWRRRFHPSASVRESTPHWLVMCLPLRVLTEQTERVVRGWLAALGIDGPDGVDVHVAMGGREDGRGEGWRERLDRDAVIVGTVDMLVSRALNRGYAASRFSWPIDFGLLHNGAHWVFDEIQLLGPALPTSRQLDAFRRRYGTALASGTTWMSATVDPVAMATVDNATIPRVVELGPADRLGGLAKRLAATRRVERVDADGSHRARSLAEAVVARHRPGTLSVAVMNTVRAARELHAEVSRLAPGVPVHLLHSRFRPFERAKIVAEVLAGPGDGQIVVATQVLEAGVDISAATLLTEAAPWPSIVQRAGRCNRDGVLEEGTLLWTPPAQPLPYPAEDVEATVAALTALDGTGVTSTMLRERRVALSRPVHPVLRSRDLLGLFDTAPDLSGNDIDIASFIRVGEELDAHLAW
ncbi:MAG: type I-G CRISPR-associated helicase/endonuclease Cas3g, partial [Acidimicrobiales bacterium]